MLTHYVDLHVAQGAGVHATPIIARAFGLVHAVHQRQAIALACAFPTMRMGHACHPGNQLRLFGLARDAIDQVADELELHPFVREYVRMGRVRAVPEGFSGPWTEYRRYRIPGRSSRLTESRGRRIEAGNSLPFLHSHSKSSGQAFSIRVLALPHTQALPQSLDKTTGIAPDSYGLAVPTRPFAVPDLPVT